jgi:hypothetical protein
VHRNKEGNLTKEKIEKVKERNVLHVTGMVLKFNNLSRKYLNQV